MEVNFTSIDLQCRICLDMQQSIEEMTSLFEMMEGNFTIADIFTNISNVELEAKDDIPNNVCSSCLTTIINFHNLLLQFEETQEFLKHILNSSKKYSPSDSFDPGEHSHSNNSETVSEEEHEASDTFCETNILYPTDTECNYNDEKENTINFEKNIDPICDEKNSISEKPQETDKSVIENVDTVKTIEETETEIIMETFKYTCDDCGDSFLYKISFNQHMLQKHNIHLNENDFIKHSSTVIFKQPIPSADFLPVIRQLSCKMIPQLQCKICKENFKSKIELKEHLNIHKTHVCPICGSAFLKKYYLTDHLVTHSSEKKYVCKICNAAFKHRHGLTAHKTAHTTIRKHICERCGLSFKDIGTLNIHIRLKHDEARNYSCSECPLKFKLKSFLDKHFIRKHTERTKDFMCSICGVTYLNKTTLLRHVSQKHSGKRPQYPCAICNKTFSVKMSLKKHMKSVHTNI